MVTYVNTSAEVKAESDICCTSSNAVEVVESLGVDRVIFLPDEFLGTWVAKQTGVDVILWKGHCIVHERFTPEEIRRFRAAYDGHRGAGPPRVPARGAGRGRLRRVRPPGMVRHVSETQPARVLMVTECSMADNVAVENPGVEMVRPCNICPYMNTITLPKILHSLQTMTHEVTIDPAVADRARLAVERMLAVGRGRGG